MSKEIYISSTPHETRLAIVESDELTEIYYERENEYTLAGSIYNGRVTRVLPGMQSSFVDIGLERDAFLYITDFMEEEGESADFDHGGEGKRSASPRPEGQRLEAPRTEAQRVEEQQREGQRGERGEGRRDRGEGRNGDARNGDRGERRPAYVSERGQEQASATPASDIALASEGRGEEFGNRRDRTDRGGRNRGRGRRDRNDRQPGGRSPETPAFGAPAMERGAFEPISAGDEGQDWEAPLASEVEPAMAAPGGVLGIPAAGAEGAELGVGAPGADGSRRWRGRRGRRRGRGTGQREDLTPIGAPGVEAANEPVVGVEDFDEVSSFEIDGRAAQAAVSAPVPVAPRVAAATEAPRVAERVGGELRRDRGDRGERNDRGDRNQRSDRDDRSGRGGRDQRTLRVPRGFAPRGNLYGVDASAEAGAGAAEQDLELAAAAAEPQVEPLILPGESLSKYRKDSDEGSAADRPSAASLATPVVLPDHGFKVDPNWDGSAVLPGETLSRYRGGSAPARTAETRGGGRPDRSERDSRSDRSGRSDFRREDSRRDQREAGGRDRQPMSQSSVRDEAAVVPQASAPEADEASVMLVPSSAPPADLQSAGPVSGYAFADEKTEEIHAHRPDFVHAALPEPTAEAPQMEGAGHASDAGREGQEGIHQIDAAQPQEAPAAASAPEAEYEPEEGFASYRVDPAAPSEYRQSAPATLEPEPHTAPEMASAPMEQSPATVEEEPQHEEHGGHHPLEVAPSGEVFVAHETGHESKRAAAKVAEASCGIDPVYTEPDLPAIAHAEPLHPMPEVNFVHPTAHEHLGEASEARVGDHDVTEIAATGDMLSEPPTVHVESGEAEVAPVSGVGIDRTELEREEQEYEQAPQGFAPGAGDLEEDFIEEEELEPVSLHAHGEEEFDDLEEEQLEGTADLGTMIREMSIDHITRTDGGSSEQEELDEDFEEDTLDGAGPEQLRVEEDREDAQDIFEEGEGSSRGGYEGFVGEEEESISKIGLDRDATEGSSAPAEANTYNNGRGRRDGRREPGRGRGDRNGGREYGDRAASSDRPDRSGLGERARNTGGGGDRDRGRSNGRGGRQSMQSTNLPAISELLKPGQEILCQIAKEPIAKKGARITSHIALPGRFLVFMPTVSHTGVSRKIESDAERRRLKEILLSEKGDAAGGFIVRTAAAGASEDELRSDLRFLLNLWTDIKQRSESSKSPALIYHDLNLVERILRDQVTDNFSAIWVDTETEYERVLRFLQRFQPALIRRVKLYTKETPLFEQFGITEEINKALRSKVWLKSGGSIVINQTEALVAIDINTGKFVGKTARLEDTIVKTNLDAIPEIVRQIRLRDLGGIIIIDFIDMDERKNRNRVMAALEEELKSDRAPSKVLPFNDFGLVAITRKRVKQSLERTLSTTCNVCVGTGMVKSPVTVCNDIYVEMKKMHKHLDRGDVMLRVHPEVVKQLKSTGSRWLQEMEEMCGKTILIKSDPSLHPEQFDIH
jgi:ribonuclease E